MNLLGIDFEDWYHPELIQRHLNNKNHSPTVINGIDKILDLLRKEDTNATFFVVGELLHYKPELVDKILDGGHEIAFHTMYHTRLDANDYKEKFSDELETFAKLTAKRSRGFRAPTFSLNYSSSWAVEILVNHGYLYDSSIVPAKTKLYGISNAPEKPYKILGSAIDKNSPEGKLIEFPLLVTCLLGKKIPAGGGFYLRTLPFKIIENALLNYEKKGFPGCFYVHSWELTPEYMPKIALPFIESFVTYHNIKKTFNLVKKLIKKYKFTSFEKFMSEKHFVL